MNVLSTVVLFSRRRPLPPELEIEEEEEEEEEVTVNVLSTVVLFSQRRPPPPKEEEISTMNMSSLLPLIYHAFAKK